jgi:hypothetical protein
MQTMAMDGEGGKRNRDHRLGAEERISKRPSIEFPFLLDSSSNCDNKVTESDAEDVLAATALSRLKNIPGVEGRKDEGIQLTTCTSFNERGTIP